MKRSEIIDIIIDELCNHEPISREQKNIEFTAEWILKRIEDKGMQPPNIIKSPDTWFRSTGDYGYEAAEWEPENEN